jgi:hypothetical protein
VRSPSSTARHRGSPGEGPATRRWSDANRRTRNAAGEVLDQSVGSIADQLRTKAKKAANPA